MTARILLLGKIVRPFCVNGGGRVLPVQIEKAGAVGFPAAPNFFVEVNAHVHNFIIRPVLWL